MNILDDDSLVHIYSELEFAQKILLQRVCTRWRRILKSHAPYANMQSVNIADYVSDHKAAHQSEYQDTISGLIQHAGPHIRELDFSHRWPRVPQNIINQISEKCCQLTKLDMGWVRLEAVISPLLDRIAPQLLEFSLEETTWADDKHAEMVTQYIPKMKQLRRLNLRKFGAPLEELSKLDSGRLEFLDVSEADQLSGDTMVHFLEANPQLLVLHLCPMPPSCLPLIAMSTTSGINLPGPFLGFVRPPKQARRRFTEGEIPAMRPKKKKGGADLQALINKLGTMQHLRTLWLGHIPYAAHFLSLKALADMAELRHLHIKECNALDGNSLIEIVKGISETLRQLSLLNCAQLDDFSGLSQCMVLSQLDVEKGKRLTSTDLIALSEPGKLRILRLKDCPAISDSAVWTVIEKCPSLKELELINSNSISADFFSNASAFSQMQKLERLSLSGCQSITKHSILQAVEILQWNMLNSLDLSRNMNIDDSILAPIWNKLEKEKHKRNGKTLTLHAAGTGITREAGKQFEPLIDLMF